MRWTVRGNRIAWLPNKRTTQRWFGLGEHSQSYNYSSASVQTTWRRWSGLNALSLIKDMVNARPAITGKSAALTSVISANKVSMSQVVYVGGCLTHLAGRIKQ